MYCKWHCTIVSLGAAEEPNNMRSQASQSAYKSLWPARQPRPLTLGFLPSATEITATGTISFTVHLCHTLEENVLYETSTLYLQSKILQIFQGKQNDVYNSLLKQLKYKPKPGVKIKSCLLCRKFVTHIHKIDKKYIFIALSAMHDNHSNLAHKWHTHFITVQNFKVWEAPTLLYNFTLDCEADTYLTIQETSNTSGRRDKWGGWWGAVVARLSEQQTFFINSCAYLIHTLY